MLKLTRALLCALLVLATLGPISGGKFGGGRSGGFGRGGGGHSYPSSHSGLSGSGSRHSGGLSGGGHGYPSSGGSHGYPSSGGLSGSGGSHGYPSSGGSHGYPSSGGSHGYPSGGLSGGGTGGKHTYPSGGGLSGGNSQSHNYPNRGTGGTHTTHTTINHNYNYAPPKQISYSAPGQRPVSYPVYHGPPPTYVYQYKNSGSKYGTLLAGLALLNLGALAGTAYAVSQSHNSHSQSSYKPQPGEYCKFGVKKDNGDYEETRIDCQLITSFIFQEQAKAPTGGTNSTVVSTSVTNVTVVNATNGVEQPTTPPNVLYQMLPNGTLVPVNITLPNADNTTNVAANGTVMTSVTTTTTNTTTSVTNALDVKGKEIQVTPGMQCFVMRHTPTTNMRRAVPCGLLQTYADQSIKKNSAARNIPTFTLLCAVVAFVLH